MSALTITFIILKGVAISMLVLYLQNETASLH